MKKYSHDPTNGGALDTLKYSTILT